jgi:hypothetical protein
VHNTLALGPRSVCGADANHLLLKIWLATIATAETSALLQRCRIAFRIRITFARNGVRLRQKLDQVRCCCWCNQGGGERGAAVTKLSSPCGHQTREHLCYQAHQNDYHH